MVDLLPPGDWLRYIVPGSGWLNLVDIDPNDILQHKTTIHLPWNSITLKTINCQPVITHNKMSDLSKCEAAKCGRNPLICIKQEYAHNYSYMLWLTRYRCSPPVLSLRSMIFIFQQPQPQPQMQPQTQSHIWDPSSSLVQQHNYHLTSMMPTKSYSMELVCS